jgi:hypothetical protein
LRVLDQPVPVKEYVAAVFAQLGEIQFFRDRLAHHLTSRNVEDPSGATFLNLDIFGVREQARAVTLTFGLTAIEAATADVNRIPFLLSDICQGVTGEAPMPPIELPTWQYKPSMLGR